MPEALWKAYIDFEILNEEWDRTRALYDALLERTKHVKASAPPPPPLPPLPLRCHCSDRSAVRALAYAHPHRSAQAWSRGVRVALARVGARMSSFGRA